MQYPTALSDVARLVVSICFNGLENQHALHINLIHLSRNISKTLFIRRLAFPVTPRRYLGSTVLRREKIDLYIYMVEQRIYLFTSIKKLPFVCFLDLFLFLFFFKMWCGSTHSCTARTVCIQYILFPCFRVWFGLV